MWVEFTEFTVASSKVAGMSTKHPIPYKAYWAYLKTPYKLLQFELSDPGVVYVFVSACLFLLSFVAFVHLISIFDTNEVATI